MVDGAPHPMIVEKYKELVLFVRVKRLIYLA
jgi:hypothetical protein